MITIKDTGKQYKRDIVLGFNIQDALWEDSTILHLIDGDILPFNSLYVYVTVDATNNLVSDWESHQYDKE